MTYFSFQPAFDVFHTCFRMLRLKMAILDAHKTIDTETLRVLDFYYLFPFRAVEIKFGRTNLDLRKAARSFDDFRQYGLLPDSALLFSEMKVYQDAAITKLVRKGCFIKIENELKPTAIVLLIDLTDQLLELSSREKELTSFLGLLLRRHADLGSESLRARSGLIETRYDSELKA